MSLEFQELRKSAALSHLAPSHSSNPFLT